jgi:hypothetical protein
VFITERSIQTHALSKKKQKMKQTVFFLADLYTKPIGSPLIINGFP